MPQQATHYRVFIASPGGLDDIRKAFYETLRQYNEDEGIHDGVHFDGVGWEGTLQGRGRPQELINEDLRTCDYFVLVLWDRWGSPPAREGESRFSSGCEEEFFEAETCLASDGHPMQQLVVLFRGVEPERLAEPDQQLASVLEFRGKLEAGKRDLYGTFDEVGEFRRSLRRLLGSWRRNSRAERVQRELTPEFTVASAPSDRAIQEAERLETEGETLQAEALFAKAVSRSDNVDALIRYGHFLYRGGRRVQAEAVYEQARRQAGPATSELGRALCGLSLVNATDPAGHRAAVAFAKDAIETFERADDHRGLAIAITNLGAFHASVGNFDESLDAFFDALKKIDLGSDLALQLWTNLALVSKDSGTQMFARDRRAEFEDLRAQIEIKKRLATPIEELHFVIP